MSFTELLLCVDTVTRNMYLANLIKEKDIRFLTDVKYGEDTIFSWTYLKYCRKIYVSSKVTYCASRIYLDSSTYRYYENIASWRNKIFFLLRELSEVYNISESVWVESLEVYLAYGLSFCICSAMKLEDELERKDKIRQCLTIFEPYIDYCETYKKRNNLPMDKLVYTRDVDLIYQKYADQMKKERLRNAIRKIAVKFIGPFVERKYTKLVMSGKL